MNENIKTLIAGAVIALAGAAVGGTIVAWTVGKAEGQELRVEGKLSAQRPPFSTSPNQFRAPPNRPPGGTNSFMRPGVTAAFPTSSAAFQKAQDLPEVKKAREEFMEAQKKYVSAMQGAMGPNKEANSQPPAANSQPAKK
jgi:hypothetical protein